MAAFSWGVDGHGRFHLCYRYGRDALFCGLNGVTGPELALLYKECGC